MIKRVIPFIMLIFLLAGCQFTASQSVDSTPTMTDAEMATRVSQILTSMPTSTSQVPVSNPTNTVIVLPPSPTPEGNQAQPTVPGGGPSPTANSGQENQVTPEDSNSNGEPTPEPSETQVPTDTVEPTRTPTTGPTLQPGDPRKELGEPDYNDPMNEDSSGSWPIDEDSYSVGSLADDALVLTGKQKISAWRLTATESLTNAYIETSIKTGSCSGDDAYGLIFRVPNLHDADQGYLFGLTCSGSYYLKKWNGKADPGVMSWLVDYTNSSAILVGADQTNRLGVLTKGNKISLYINGTLVKEYEDSSYGSGNFGMFIQPSASDKFTIYVDYISYWKDPSFTPSSTQTPVATNEANTSGSGPAQNNEANMVDSQNSYWDNFVNNTINPTATYSYQSTNPTVTPEYLPGDPRYNLGNPSWYDTLENGTYWPIDEDDYSIGVIKDEALVFTGKKPYTPTWRLTATEQLTDAYIEAKIKTEDCDGSDSFGIMFRVPDIASANQGYLYGLTCDGAYYLKQWDGKANDDTDKLTTLIDYTFSSAVHYGAYQTNRLGVTTYGNRILLYLNGVYQQETSDSTFQKGNYGVFVQPYDTENFSIHIEEAGYWAKP